MESPRLPRVNRGKDTGAHDAACDIVTGRVLTGSQIWMPSRRVFCGLVGEILSVYDGCWLSSSLYSFVSGGSEDKNHM